MFKNRGMDSPHAWVTTAIGQYLLLVWGATVICALVLVAVAGVWARYRPRRADDVPPVAGTLAKYPIAASSPQDESLA